MCRSIKTLRRPDGRASDEEIAAAALQFVRKVSGYRARSERNTQAFDAAVSEVGRASRRLLEAIEQSQSERRARCSRGRAYSKCGRRPSTSAPTYSTVGSPDTHGPALREG